MKRLLSLAALCVLTASLYAQTSTIASAGTGLVSQLSKGLAISPTQAKGGAARCSPLPSPALAKTNLAKSLPPFRA